MTVGAPQAPGALGVAAQPQAVLKYLQDLGEWVTGRRSELDALDQAVIGSDRAAELTPDMTLSMALWQAVKARYDLLVTAWDSGRVGPTELDRISALTWGSLDAAPGAGSLNGMTVSLPEACRLSDALVGQLRTKLQLDPDAGQLTLRLKDLRAQVERLRDQVALEPTDGRPLAQAKLEVLAQRVEDLAEKAARGGDIGGLLGPLEIQAATFERDLIVNGALRRQNRDLLARVRQTLVELAAREQALRLLVRQVVAQVSPAPKYAVPDVAALGAPPNTAEALTAFEARLAKVSEAMAFVQRTYTEALQQHPSLQAQRDGLAARAEAAGVAKDPGLVHLDGTIDSVLSHQPSPVALVQQLLNAYQSYLEWLTTEAS
ncbi:MAG: hypothetical protein WAV45_07990 [Propionibacteriaceae bacterium]|nr:hypothetical protein [Micropruina sp.]HBX81818.1 hypothetical protein [Propionibacteriaceae bacterium]HBY23509.1 hypothetical protein [Propionibacteriaceae bacterium]